MRKGVRAERSAIPAKGDRGLSGSAMVRSYSQVPRTTRGRIGRHLPLRPGPAGDVQRRLVPRRGWECWTLEMAEHLIFKRLLEVISSRAAGNGRSPGQPPLPDFQGHFHGPEGGPAGWTSRMPQMRSRWKNFRLNTRRSGGHESYSKTATTVGFRSATALATCCVGCACS